MRSATTTLPTSPSSIALALTAVAVVAALLGLQTSQGKAFAVLAQESRVEVGKVVWPNPQERMQTTLVVLALVFVMSLILWGLDSPLVGAYRASSTSVATWRIR